MITKIKKKKIFTNKIKEKIKIKIILIKLMKKNIIMKKIKEKI